MDNQKSKCLLSNCDWERGKLPGADVARPHVLPWIFSRYIPINIERLFLLGKVMICREERK
jgi:hypothetical protein